MSTAAGWSGDGMEESEMFGSNTENTAGIQFETLEGRTLMSVAPMAFPHLGSAPAKPALVVKKTPVNPALTAPIQPEPAVTNPGMKYQSFANDPLFSSTGPSPDDVKQGYIGDCYFLSSLASIAKVNPTIIRNDITNVGDGTYTVKFMTGKTPQYVRVDADLPVWSDGQLAYAGLGKDNCMWVAVMEKAYADFRTHAHSYESIDGGWMSDAFGALGLPARSIFAAASTKMLMNLISTAVRTKHFATFATGDAITDGAPLIADHAYEIDSVNYDAKHAAVSVRLRNPWGVDGVGNDGNNDGYVTITAAQALHDMSGVVFAHA
jgi:hypothetical protein